jgi:hypothetical protein
MCSKVVAASSVEDEVAVDFNEVKVRWVDIQQQVPLVWNGHVLSRRRESVIWPLGGIGPNSEVGLHAWPDHIGAEIEAVCSV